MAAINEFELKVDGTLASAELLALVTEVEVVGRSGRSSEFTLRLEAGSVSRLLKAVDGFLADALAAGREVVISHVGGRRRSPIVEGVIDSVGLDLRSEGRDSIAALVVRGHDLAYPLTQRESVRTFEEQSAADVAQQIASDHGLRAEVDATPVQPRLVQSGQTDWDFLTSLAAGSGRELRVEGKSLFFSEPGSTGETRLRWGRGLVSFQPEVNLSRQTAEVTVRGWDPESKRAVEGSHSTGGRDSEGAVRQIGRRVVRTEEEAKNLAASVAGSLTDGSRRASGVVRPGLAGLRPGGTVSVDGVGGPLGGSYRLTAVTHRFTADGYTTELEAGVPEIAEALPAGDCPAPCGQPSVAIGVVIDNQHPEGGRAGVRVSFPWLADEPSDWIRVATPMAGDERGVYFLPEIGDEVLVAFEHGDLAHPYVIGALWNGVDRPPATNENGDNDIRVMRSRSGHRIVFDDTDGAERLELDDGSGNRVVLDSAAGELLIESAGDLTLKAAGDLLLEGNLVTVNAADDLKLNGEKSIAANADGNLDLSSEGTSTLEASGETVIRGSLVRIN